MKALITLLLFLGLTSISWSQIAVDSAITIVSQSGVFLDKKDEIEKRSNGDRTLMIVYLNGIDDGENYYKIKGCVDNGKSINTKLHFHYYYNTEELFLFDPLKMEEIRIPY